MERQTEDRATARAGGGRKTGNAARPGDFASFVARNVDPAYRLGVLLVGDPIAVQDSVHDAVMAAWQAGGTWPAAALDAAFGRRLVGEYRRLLRTPERFVTAALDEAAPPATAAHAGAAAPPGAAALEQALAGLEPNDQLLLAERLGMPGEIEPVAATLRGRGSLDRRLPDALGRLRAATGTVGTGDRPLVARDAPLATREPPLAAATAGVLEAQLRALYAGRDPGDAPSTLRWRIQRSLIEAEQAAAEQAEIAAASGWGFPVKVVGAFVLLTLVIATASVVRIRQNQAAASSGVGPGWPLAIARVALVIGGVDGPGVHVAATSGNLVASYQASPFWHVSERDCRADVVGTVGPDGNAQWLGQLAGHLDRLVGDPASPTVYAAGPGALCDPGRYTSSDGGRTWIRGPLPEASGETPTWLAFDPSTPRHLYALGSGSRLYASADAGNTWTSRLTGAVPIGFDSDGRLVGWQPGKLVDSWDRGATWLEVSGGPADAPLGGAATPRGTLVATGSGLWWYPIDGDARIVRGGHVLAVSSLGEGAVALGMDAGGHPWLEAVSDGEPIEAALPPSLAGLTVSGGEVAANSNGALVALAGSKSAIAFVSFAP